MRRHVRKSQCVKHRPEESATLALRSGSTCDEYVSEKAMREAEERKGLRTLKADFAKQCQASALYDQAEGSHLQHLIPVLPFPQEVDTFILLTCRAPQPTEI